MQVFTGTLGKGAETLGLVDPGAGFAEPGEKALLSAACRFLTSKPGGKRTRGYGVSLALAGRHRYLAVQESGCRVAGSGCPGSGFAEPGEKALSAACRFVASKPGGKRTTRGYGVSLALAGRHRHLAVQESGCRVAESVDPGSGFAEPGEKALSALGEVVCVDSMSRCAKASLDGCGTGEQEASMVVGPENKNCDMRDLVLARWR